jgi:outer membrane lipoprotein
MAVWLRRSGRWVAIAILAACARPPAVLQGDFSSVPVDRARDHPGTVTERVRWGGELVRTTPEQDHTCFEVIEKPLDREARPEITDEPTGRFVACVSGFYDPAVWEPGREVTAVGRVDGTVTTRVGETDHRSPRLAADAIYLWPVERRVRAVIPTVSIGVGFGL